MNWSKIKTIMIVFLLFLNIFLVSFLAITTFQENNISNELVESSISVLSKKGIVCDREIFPAKKYTLPRLSVKYYQPSELCDMFFGKQIPFRTEGDILLAESDGAVLKVKGSYFIYETNEKPSTFKESKYKSSLKKTGFDISNSRFNDKTKEFNFYYDGVLLSGVYLKAELDENGKPCRIEGEWPSSVKKNKQERISFTDSLIKLSSSFPAGGKIDDISLIYSSENKAGKTFYFAPYWKITVNNETKILK